MKKNTILKTIMFIITFALIVCASTTVFADDALDLTNSLTGGNSTTQENTTTENTSPENTTTENEVPDITPSPTTPSNTTENTTSNTNTSTYEESDIPHAGVEDTILMGAAFIVCAIIGVYTFMKMSDYSNI